MGMNLIPDFLIIFGVSTFLVNLYANLRDKCHLDALIWGEWHLFNEF